MSRGNDDIDHLGSSEARDDRIDLPGEVLISKAVAVLTQNPDPLAAVTAVRRAAPDESDLARAAALSFARLRLRGRARLGSWADSLYLTDDGLAAATRPPVAMARAQRLRDSGVSVVLDLGCGLGIDSLAFARVGLKVIAIESNPTIAQLADRNTPDAVSVRCDDVTDPQVLDAALAEAHVLAGNGIVAAFVDPARRDPGAPRSVDGVQGRRISSPRDWSPPWPWVAALANRVAVVAKVAPGIDRDLAGAGWETAWTSIDGALVEAAVWSPALARSDREHVAIRLTSQSSDPAQLAATVETHSPAPLASARPPGRWLLDPDDALTRAGLVGHLAAEVDGWLLDPHLAWVSTDNDLDSAWAATRCEVIDWGPFTSNRLRESVRAQRPGSLTITTRGVSVDVDALRATLLPRKAVTRGGPEIVVALARTDAGHIALTMRRAPRIS